MDAISVDIAGLTTEDRNGLSFNDFAEIAWAILQSTYSGDNEVEVLRYSKFESRNTNEQVQHALSAVAYHIDEGLSLSEIVRTRRNISKPAHTQRSKDDINTYRLHSLIKRAIVVTEHVNQEYGVHPSGGINSDSNNETALFADPCENLVVHIHGHKHTPCVELRFPKTRALQSFITYVADTFGQLGQSLSLHPNSPLKDLNLIGSLNRNCIQRLARAPSKLSTACLGDILLQQGIERPEHLAINSWDGTFTYSELHYLSFRLAAVLLDQEIAPEERILLCMKKSRWAIVAMFGILLAGATCIPLDINSPQKRLRTIREKVVARVAVVDDFTASLFEQMGMKTVTSSAQLEHAVIPKIPLPKTAASATAFIYFTSGSTGTPKGVVLQHGALMASIIEVAKAYSLDDTSRVFQFAAYTFDVSMGDIFGTTSAGGCLCIPSEEERMDHVAAAMNKLGATHACLTSTVLAHIEPKDVISLRYLFVGGEALDRAQFACWKQYVNFNVVYGTTESLIWDSLATSRQLELDASTLGLSIGSWLWVVHPQEAENLKPIGAIGEILVEGPLLAEGYLDDPVTTSSKFISAPQWLQHLRQDSQVRCYRTGDMGYYNANGTVTFVGRLDTQIKILGTQHQPAGTVIQAGSCGGCNAQIS
jgi:amino acid adenylation domain-containing protein